MKQNINMLKEHFKPGMKLRLLEMNDPQAPAAGTCGTVQGVDDLGSILMRWDNGSGLSLIPGEDRFEEIL